MHCIRRKKVRMKGSRKLVLRCAKYSGRKRRASGYRKRSSTKRRASGGYRRGHRPYNKGKSCVAWKTNKRGIRSCASYGGAPRGARAAYSSWWGSAMDARNRERVHVASSPSLQNRLRAYKASKYGMTG
jgi:hypothetical protein